MMTYLAQHFGGEVDEFDHFCEVLRQCWTEGSR
jgi:hypothetical protein